MGGIKNRDEKRKKANVFASGGGGGAKGPSVIDKRGQEENCPYCDRVFKQSDRLKQHIAKQHADQPQEDAQQPAAAAAKPPQALAAASSSNSRAGGAGSSSSQAPPPRKPSPSLVAAAAAAAASCGGRGSGAAGSSAASGSSGQISSSAAGPRMFDVGSAGGYYTEKSPKLMLHEWCTQRKRPKPKYKAVPIDPDKGGGYRARVVLPDPKLPGSDKDVIVWLDASFACASEEEAGQRGALAALQAVAGERSLEYVLPQRYRPLWGDLKQQAAERAESQRRAAAAAAQAKARQAAVRAASSARAPVAVVMSDKQREAVEDLMQELAAGVGLLGGAAAAGSSEGLGGSNGSSGLGSVPDLQQKQAEQEEECAEAASQFIDGLVRGGFSAADAAAAVKAVGVAAGMAAATAATAASAAAAAGGRRVTRVYRSHEGLQPYLDWLCIRLPVERLPSRYRPGGSSGTVGVLRLNSSSNTAANSASSGSLAAPDAAAAAAAAAAGSADDALSWQDDPHVAQLVSYGYPPDHAMQQLQAARGDLLCALHALQAQLKRGSTAAAAAGGGGAEPPVRFAADSSSSSEAALPQEWRDEVEVLAAIYGEDLLTSSSSSCSAEEGTAAAAAAAAGAAGSLTLAVDGGEQVDGKVLLHVWCPIDPTPYPCAPPLLALSCHQLAPGQLLHLTQRLCTAAEGLVGDPMVHELAVQLGEGLEQLSTAQHSTAAAPPPFNQPARAAAAARSAGVRGSEGVSAVGGSEGPESEDDGYTAAAQQHAAAAEALLQGGGGASDASSTISSSSSGGRGSSSVSSSTSSRGQPRRRGPRQLSQQQQQAESRRLAEYFKALQVDPRHSSMRGVRSRLPAAACRQQVLEAVGASDVVVISGATGCGKSTQVPQYLLEQAVASGAGGSTNIIVCQPRRIAAVGLATRVAAELGDPVGVGGLCGYSVRLDSKVSDATRLMFVTTGVLLRRLMSDPQLTGVTHIVLDEVHERNLESDLLLMLLRRALLLAQCSSSSSSRQQPRLPKVLLMSATADAQLFGDYFSKAGPDAVLTNNGSSTTISSTRGKSSSSSSSGRLAVSLLSIPGFTHPVRQLWLEDALQQTGVVIGKTSKYARKKKPKSSTLPDLYEGGDSGEEDEEDDSGTAADSSSSNSSRRPQQQQQQQQQQRRTPSKPAAGSSGDSSGGGVSAGLGVDAPPGGYSQEVLSSLSVVDPSLINYDLIEALLVHVAATHVAQGPTALLKDWRNAPPGALEAAAAAGGSDLGAVLVFMPGAPEIDRLVRQLQGSSRLASAVGRAGGVRVLPLHGGLPPAVQSRVFERPPPGVLKVVVATNVAETSLTIDDVTVVLDTGRHKEMSYDSSRGLSRLSETWVSQAAAQQRRGRAGRVRPGVCYRLFPARMWARLAPQQPPEVLRVPLQQLCLSTKAALRAALAGGGPQPSLAQVLSCLLTPPPVEAVQEAVQQLTSLGALQQPQQQPQGEVVGEVLTPLGEHLADMPMDAALGKALLYGCMLRCASPLLTIAAALAHGRPLWVSPPPDKRGEAEAARRALAGTALAQRSDHLALIAAFNAWTAARAAGGRGAGADFARQHFLSEQVCEAIAKGRLDFASTLTQRGFLPAWYSRHLASMHQQGATVSGAAAAGGGGGAAGADVYGSEAVCPGGPDEYSHNSRVIKAAIAAGFYPHILRVEAPVKYQAVAGGAMRVESDPAQIKFFERGLGRVWLHPASVCFKAGSYSSGWLVFTQLVETSRPFVREASMVPVYGLLAFGGQLEVLHEQGLLLLDGWAKFKAPARVGVLIQALRQAVSGLLAAKVQDPSLDLAGQKVVQALHSLLATDGF